ncbi:DUF5050 domain-containing protein [Bacillus massiliigorillae]|uniref:DUF5050 domain-containing protein n=1 Tax=Bacillus massiliigorillae TaxID=1243664 RepID=UPI0003A23077|nr:DUF5050 domain-containing protein [Bacillus massiliigorillae]
MKKLLLSIIALGLMLAFASPSFASAQWIQGSSQGNLANYGYITEDKDWYYFYDGGISKIKKDGTGRVKIIDASKSGVIAPVELTLVGNYIYYSDLMFGSPGSKSGIFRLNLVNKSIDQIANMDARYYKIVNNKIYYLAYSDMNWSNKSIYVSDLNGKNKKKLTGTVSSFTTEGSYLYYQTYNGLYRATLDNKSKVKLTSSQAEKPIISDKTIYYINKSDKNKLYKMNLNGTNNSRLTQSSVATYNFYNGKIIYSNTVNYPNTSPLYVMNTNGKNISALTTKTFDNLFVLGDKIIYANQNIALNGWADYRLGSVKNGKLSSPSVLFRVYYP